MSGKPRTPLPTSRFLYQRRRGEWVEHYAGGIAALRLRLIDGDDAADIEFLWQMLYYASHSHHEPGISVADIKRNPDLTRHLAGYGRHGDLGFIAHLTDRRVGACWLRLFQQSERTDVTYHDAHTPELVISVEPDMIGQGAGSQLLRRVISEADAAAVPSIVLSARASNPAIGLYERHGFEVIDRITNRVGTESVQMLRLMTASG